MNSQLGGLNVCITGAGGGIGQALARAFAGEGCGLSLHEGRTRGRLPDALVEELERADVEVHRWSGDVREEEVVARGVQEGAEALGGLDLCIVNAGIWPDAALPLHEQPSQRIREVLEINLLGAMWTARAFTSALARRGPRADGRGASLCFIGSTAGRFGEAGHAEYATTKAAMMGLVRSLKNELVQIDPYARVNMVEPGWTVTPMARAALDQPGTVARVVASMPVRQLARPEDIARAALVLSAPGLSRHVSGEVLTVAGGMEGRTLWTPDQIDEDEIRARLDRE